MSQNDCIWNCTKYEEMNLKVTPETKLYLSPKVHIPVMKYMGLKEPQMCTIRVNETYRGIEINNNFDGWITDSEIPSCNERTGRVEYEDGTEVPYSELWVGEDDDKMLHGVSLEDDTLEGKECPCLQDLCFCAEDGLDRCKCENGCVCEEGELVSDLSFRGTYVGIIPEGNTSVLKKTPCYYNEDGTERHKKIDVVTHRITKQVLGYFIYFVCCGVSFEDKYSPDEGAENNKLMCKKGALAACGDMMFFC